jgi:lipopolysaccharide cholinephosphotransferase
MEQETLRRLQLTQLEIMKFVDSICKEHNIKYTLYAGTALGAVRHGGFIPWDDDLDIAMERKEYEKFIAIWNKIKPIGYHLQDSMADEKSTINFVKVRKDNTVFLTEHENENLDHHGIFIDIFPLDKVATTKMAKLYIYFWGFIRMLYTRGYVAERNGIIIKILTFILLGIVPRRYWKNIKELSNKKVRKFENLETGFEWVCLTTPKVFKKYYPQNMMESIEIISFEGTKLNIVSKYNEMLRIQFGDYMKLPPIEEQKCTHNPRKVEF